MRSWVATTALGCLAMVGWSSAWARNVAGVELPETTSVDGTVLHLTGFGVAKKRGFKVYVMGLYLEKPTHDARVAISTDQAKRMMIVMLRDIDRQQFVAAVLPGFERNSAQAMQTLRERITRLARAIPDLNRGDSLDFTYLPGVGTLVRGGEREVAIEGKDFADALFSIWLGQNPVDRRLKRELLSQ